MCTYNFISNILHIPKLKLILHSTKRTKKKVAEELFPLFFNALQARNYFIAFLCINNVALIQQSFIFFLCIYLSLYSTKI